MACAGCARRKATAVRIVRKGVRVAAGLLGMVVFPTRTCECECVACTFDDHEQCRYGAHTVDKVH